MAAAAPSRRNGAVRPFLLAAGLGLFWFAEAGDSALPIEAPVLGIALIQGSRLFVDLVGGWVIVSAARIVLELARLVRARWRLAAPAQTR